MSTLASDLQASGRGRSFAMTLLFGVAALTIALAGARSIADIIGPVFLALVLTVTLHPIRIWLEGHGVRQVVASIIMLVASYALLILLTLALMVSVAQLAALVPEYTDQIHESAASAGDTLKNLGVEQEQIDAVVGTIDPGELVDFAMSLLSGTLGVLTDMFFLFTVLLFMAFDTDSTRRSLATLGRRYPAPIEALDNFARGSRNYMGVSASFGLIVAIIDGLALYFMDVPGAFVWAVLAFVTNFIPNIGFIIGVIPPALIALLDSGPDQMVAVIVVYSVVNFVIQSVIQPRVVGDAVGLSAILTFLSLVFWTWVVGPLGAILAVPLSLFTKALLVEADAGARWALPLISGRPDPTEPDESLEATEPTAAVSDASDKHDKD